MINAMLIGCMHRIELATANELTSRVVGGNDAQVGVVRILGLNNGKVKVSNK